MASPPQAKRQKVNMLDSWTTQDVMAWVRANLSSQYHQCLDNIQEHDIDGKLLSNCLEDEHAREGLLKILFPSAADAFLRLSFMRKIEKFDERTHAHDDDDQDSDDVDMAPPTPGHKANESPTTNTCACSHCGVRMSPFLIANHERHCSKQLRDGEEKAEAEAEPAQDAAMVVAEIEEHICVKCEFCEIDFNLALIDEHTAYCGSRTDQCPACHGRDTLLRFKLNMHQCHATRRTLPAIPQQQQPPKVTHSALDMGNAANSSWISSFERHLYALQKLLHDRFIVDYDKAAVHFERFDHFGNDKHALSRQKHNHQLAQVRTYSASDNVVSNESRCKFEKPSAYQNKTKDELRFETKLTPLSLSGLRLKLVVLHLRLKLHLCTASSSAASSSRF